MIINVISILVIITLLILLAIVRKNEIIAKEMSIDLKAQLSILTKESIDAEHEQAITILTREVEDLIESNNNLTSENNKLNKKLNDIHDYIGRMETTPFKS